MAEDYDLHILRFISCHSVNVGGFEICQAPRGPGG